jgi:succinate dehydrogenase/fumarate reductase flavoprotein subunit
MPSERVVETHALVIRGGVAGCFAAIKARELGAANAVWGGNFDVY